MADSRPLPGPCTRTWTRRSPRFIASRPQFSAATVAANGVDFLDPLNPAFPAEPQASVFPRMSVMVISRLLNVAEMWAIPSVSTTFLARLGLAARAGAGAVILLLRHFLLAGDGPPGTLLGPRIGVSPLTPHRQPSAVPDSPVAPDIHQPLDVHGDFGAERALHLHRTLDHLAETRDLGIREIAHSGVRIDSSLSQNAAAGGPSDSEDVGEGDLDPLLPREIDAGDTRHKSALPLFVLGIALADDA